MRTFALVFHLILTLFMIVVILLQRSEGGGLAAGGGGAGGMTSARSAANLLTRTTGILAALFIGSNILLAILAQREVRKEIVNVKTGNASAVPAQVSVEPIDQPSGSKNKTVKRTLESSETPPAAQGL